MNNTLCRGAKSNLRAGLQQGLRSTYVANGYLPQIADGLRRFKSEFHTAKAYCVYRLHRDAQGPAGITVQARGYVRGKKMHSNIGWKIVTSVTPWWMPFSVLG